MIHTPENTPPSRVFVDGKEIKGAFYADTSKGEVRYYPQPPIIKPGTDEIYSETIYGKVRVKPI